MNEAKKYWEERALKYKSDVRGVLFKKPYPAFMNKMFHKWSFSLVKKVIHKKDGKFLDIACGWGRLSENLLNVYPKISITGLDISAPYVKMYNQLFSPRGKAVVGTMEDMPFGDKSFDAAFLVVSLMYLPTKELQQKAINEIVRVLKKNGRFMLIEPTPWMGLFDIRQKFHRRRHKQITFTSSAIHALIKKTDGQIKSVSSWPSKFFPLYKGYLIKKT